MNTNTELELKHIQLELSHSRAQHLRHFIDQYYCYKHDYVNRNGKAKWSDIMWNEYVSIEASELRLIDDNDKNFVTKEHIVPLKVITSKLIEKGPSIQLDEIAIILDKYIQFATITKEEDKKLRQEGLTSKMPKEFYDTESES